MDGGEESGGGAARLEEIFERVIAPVLFPGGGRSLPADLPRRAIEVLDRTGDLDARGADILGLFKDQRGSSRAARLLMPGDGFSKKGRTISFRLSGPRNIPVPGAPVAVEAAGSFSLEFRRGDESFGDGEVARRFRKTRTALPSAAGGDILAAAVLPQKKNLLGVATPVKAVVAGLPFSLRFAVLLSRAGRVRLFAAGPLVKEIPL